MPQITKGFTYTPTGANSYVNAGNLNQHVDLATLAGGAIVEQAPNSASNDTDKIMISTGTGSSAAIWSQTKGQFTNTINSNIINVNTLSAGEADVDSITINGAYALSNYFNVGNAAIINTDIATPYIIFGYDNVIHGKPALMTADGLAYRFYGTSTTFSSPYNPVDVNVANTGHLVTVKGDLVVEKDLNVTKGLFNNGKQVLTEAPLAAKSGTCFILASDEIYKSQLLDIPDDETWIFTLHAFWETAWNGNTRPDSWYRIKAVVEKATYSDVEIGRWEKTYPPYGAVNNFSGIVMLTKGTLSNMTKKLKFIYEPVSGSYPADTLAHNGYFISLSKVKTSTFNTDSSVL